MSRGWITAFFVAACVSVAVVVALLAGAGGGGGSHHATPTALADPLSFAPGAADFEADLDLHVPLVGLAFSQLLSRGLGAAAAVDATPAGHALLAQRGGRGWIAWQVDGGDASVVADRLRGEVSRRQGVVGAQDGVVVIAPDRAALAAALRQARTAAGHTARRAFDRRLARLPRRSGARIAFTPAALLRLVLPQAVGTRWARGLRDAAAEVSVAGQTALVSFRLSGTSTLDALPIAPGATAPTLHGVAPIVAGLRDPGRTLAFAREGGMLSGLSVLDRLPGFLEPDLRNLGPDGTLTSSDRRTATLRLTPPDPGDWSKKLRRLDALSGLARALGLADVRIDRKGSVFSIAQHGTFAARVGVFGDAVVLSTSRTADLAAAARAPAQPAPAGSAGALALRIQPQVIFDVLDQLLGTRIPQTFVHIGALTGWARAEPQVLAGELRLPIAI